MFWWPLHSPLREQRIPLVPNSLLYLVAATVWCSLIGLFVGFGPSWSSSHYLRSIDTLHISDSLVKDWSFTRETDQETAGLLFWISAATIFRLCAGICKAPWFCRAFEKKLISVDSAE